MTDFEKEDLELQALMGEKFTDVTAPTPEAVQVRTNPKKIAENPTHKPTEDNWNPPKPAPNWMDKLKYCAKSSFTFAGLNLLIFYWQNTGLMDESIALPSMCVCAALFGLGIGKVVGNK